MIKPMALLVGSLSVLFSASGFTASSVPVVSETTSVPVIAPPTIVASEMAMEWVRSLDERLDPLQHPKILASVYEERGFLPIWQDNRAIELFQSQLQWLSLSGVSPFFSARHKTLSENLPYTTDRWQEMDVLLTDTLLMYLSYLEGLPEHGQAWLFGEGLLSPLTAVSPQSVQNMTFAADQQTLWRFLADLNVQSAAYDTLVSAMKQMSSDEQNWPKIQAKKRIIRPGYYFAQAPKLARLLGLLGDMPEKEANRLVQQNKKVLSRSLVEGVKRFQARHGLEPDGVIGPKTFEWLSLSRNERLKMLALNSERMRLWTERAPSMLIVNIPNYRLDLWLDDKHVLDSRVIVGKPERPTPLMDTRMHSVVVNPYWNVPTSIMRKDIIPKMKVDSGYLSRNNFKVIRNWQTSETIPINSINWRQVSSNSFPYRLQQKPGKRNALGRYKFIIKNKKAIYLHDTPSKRLFNRTERALSSGCIRVQEAEELASVLLQYDGFSDKRWNKVRSRRNTQTLPLEQSLPVRFIYQTAWVDEDNTIQYRNDIYDHDKIGLNSQNDAKITSVVRR